MQSVLEFRRKFRVDALILFQTDTWTVSLRPNACTLGACVISANRSRESLAELDPAEAAGLVEVVGWFEATMRERFRADKFNYLALMMVDDHLHFHALPRYAGDRDAAGMTWRDPAWPKPPELGYVNSDDPDALDRVKAALLGSAGRA